MDLRNTIDLVEANTRPAKLETTPLPYGEKELAPVLSADSINYHYGHLAKAMPSDTMQEKAMRILIALAVFCTISFSLSLGLPKVPIDPAVRYLR